MARSNEEFTYEVQQTFGVLSTNEKSGWTIELNLVKWGEHEPKYDIRPWAPERTKMGKGVGLKKEELKSLRDILNSMDLD